MFSLITFISLESYTGKHQLNEYLKWFVERRMLIVLEYQHGHAHLFSALTFQ